MTEVADFTFRLFFRHSSHAILVRACVLEAVEESIGSSSGCSNSVLVARRSRDQMVGIEHVQMEDSFLDRDWGRLAGLSYRRGDW